MGPVMTGPSFISGLRRPPRFHNSFTKYEKFIVAKSSHSFVKPKAPRKTVPWEKLALGGNHEGFDSEIARFRLGHRGHVAPGLRRLWLRPVERRIPSRSRPAPLAGLPILAATHKGDAQWARIVACIEHFPQAAEQKEIAWLPGGAKALLLCGPDLELDPAWRVKVLAANVDYDTIYSAVWVTTLPSSSRGASTRYGAPAA